MLLGISEGMPDRDAISKEGALDYNLPLQGVMYISHLPSGRRTWQKQSNTSFDAVLKGAMWKEKPVARRLFVIRLDQAPVAGHVWNWSLHQNHSSYLTTYLEGGRCSFHLILVKMRSIRLLSGEKNWLFCGHSNGHKAQVLLYIRWCKIAKPSGDVHPFLLPICLKIPS